MKKIFPKNLIEGLEGPFRCCQNAYATYQNVFENVLFTSCYISGEASCGISIGEVSMNEDKVLSTYNLRVNMSGGKSVSH